MKANEIKIIIRKHIIGGIPMGRPYVVDKHGVKSCDDNIVLPSTRLDRIADMVYSTKFKDGSDGPVLCGFVKDSVFYTIGFSYYLTGNDGINWNTNSSEFYNLFNVFKISEVFSEIDLNSFKQPQMEEVVVGIQMMI